MNKNKQQPKSGFDETLEREQGRDNSHLPPTVAPENEGLDETDDQWLESTIFGT